MLKIAIIGSRGYPYVYSGYETFVKELGERLVDRGYDITVYCHRSLFENYPGYVNGIRLVYIPTIETKFLSQFIHSFLSFLHAIFRRYDVFLVVNSANGPFGLLTKLLGKKSIINVDGLEWKRPKWKGLGARYFRFASRLATLFYTRIVTDSYEMQKIYQQEFKARSCMISYGAKTIYSAESHFIEKWHLKKDQYFLIVGRLIPDNNGELIIGEFKKSTTSKKLVVVGGVPYKDRYAARIKQQASERIIFTGYITDPRELTELYFNSFGYLHGHEFGGTNPALLKALACGCMVCALNTRFNREVLQDGQYGILFGKKRGELRDIINRLEQGLIPVTEFKKRARYPIKNHYNWDRVTRQYIDLFSGLIKGKMDETKSKTA